MHTNLEFWFSNDSLTRQPAAQMVLVNGLYLDSRNLFCKTAALTFTHFSHWSDAILSTPSVSHSLGPIALGKDLSPYPSTVLYSAVAVALPMFWHRYELQGCQTFWPPPSPQFPLQGEGGGGTSSINWSLFSLACFRSCDMRRVLILEIHFRSWKIPRPLIRTGACRNAFGVSFGNFNQRHFNELLFWWRRQQHSKIWGWSFQSLDGGQG